MRALFALLVIAACGEAPSDSKRAATPPGPAPAPPAACEALDRAQCLASTSCTLVHVDGPQYQCRPERGECEQGLVQTDEAACTKRTSCRFDPGNCYCACNGYGRTAVDDTTGPSCKCDCGFGKPPACVPKDGT